jgi:hypothetical protein
MEDERELYDEGEARDDDDEDEDFLDCHMDRSGACGKAGSEECEFECPYRAQQRLAVSPSDGGQK